MHVCVGVAVGRGGSWTPRSRSRAPHVYCVFSLSNVRVYCVFPPSNVHGQFWAPPHPHARTLGCVCVQAQAAAVSRYGGGWGRQRPGDRRRVVGVQREAMRGLAQIITLDGSVVHKGGNMTGGEPHVALCGLCARAPRAARRHRWVRRPGRPVGREGRQCSASQARRARRGAIARPLAGSGRGGGGLPRECWPGVRTTMPRWRRAATEGGGGGEAWRRVLGCPGDQGTSPRPSGIRPLAAPAAAGPRLGEPLAVRQGGLGAHAREAGEGAEAVGGIRRGDSQLCP